MAKRKTLKQHLINKKTLATGILVTVIGFTAVGLLQCGKDYIKNQISKDKRLDKQIMINKYDIKKIKNKLRI